MFQTKVTVFEKAVILDHPIFFFGGGAEATQGQLHFFKWNHVFFQWALLRASRDSEIVGRGGERET